MFGDRIRQNLGRNTITLGVIKLENCNSDKRRKIQKESSKARRPNEVRSFISKLNLASRLPVEVKSNPVEANLEHIDTSSVPGIALKASGVGKLLVADSPTFSLSLADSWVTDSWWQTLNGSGSMADSAVATRRSPTFRVHCDRASVIEQLSYSIKIRLVGSMIGIGKLFVRTRVKEGKGPLLTRVA